jgi:hypothetical protein
MARDKANLDIQWEQVTGPKQEADTPDVLMKQILDDLEEAVINFAAAQSEVRRE